MTYQRPKEEWLDVCDIWENGRAEMDRIVDSRVCAIWHYMPLRANLFGAAVIALRALS